MPLTLTCNQCGAKDIPGTLSVCPSCGDPLTDERRQAYNDGRLRLPSSQPPNPQPPAQPLPAAAAMPFAAPPAQSAFESVDVGLADDEVPRRTPQHQPPAPDASGPYAGGLLRRPMADEPPHDGDEGQHVGEHVSLEDGEVPNELPEYPIEIVPDPFINPVQRHTVRYYVCRSYIEVRSGILGKEGRSIEMWRIGSTYADVREHQSLVQMARGVGNIIIETSDEDNPNIVLENIRNHQAWFRLIKVTARDEQMKRDPNNLADASRVDGGPRSPFGHR